MYKFFSYLSIFLFLFFASGCSDSSSSSSSSQNENFTISKAPIADGTPVSTLQMLSLEFSTEINPDTINSSSVYILNAFTQTKVDSEIIIDDTNTKLTIKPYQYLKPATAYSFVVTTDVQSAAGESLSIPYAYVFTTLNDSQNPLTPISFVSSNPQIESTPDINTDIKIGFDRFIAPSDEQLFKVSTGGVEVAGTLEYFNSVVTFSPSVPLTASTTYDVEIIGSPTDMYGNSFNILSDPGAWGFQTKATALNSGVWTEDSNVVDVGHEGYLVRAVSIGGDSDYIAVAREGGVDFYITDSVPFTKVAYSLPISSKITDMKHTWSLNDGYNLLISTMSDGVYRVGFLNTTLIDSNDVEVVRYLESEANIYGVDFGLGANSELDKIYAVGPSMGLKVLNLDVDGNLTTIDSIAIDGSPLKVVSHGGGAAARHIFVSDYEHGVWSFDENGGSQVDTNITSSANHIFQTNDTLADLVYAINAVGNYQYINADTPASVTNTDSALSYVSDVSAYTTSQEFITMPDKGVIIYDANYMSISNVNLIKPSSGTPVSATIANGDTIVILTKEGKLFMYFNLG